MKCPCCGNEMESGIVQSARTIFFITKEHKNWFFQMSQAEKKLFSVLIIGQDQPARHFFVPPARR